MSAFGGISGLIIALILLYETPIQGILMITLLGAGLTGSARLLMGVQRPVEIFTGYMLGFGVVLTTILLY